MIFLLSCAGEHASHETAHADETAETAAPAPFPVRVRVTLDGEPVADTLVLQGGAPGRWTTDADGYADVEVDPAVAGDHYVIAAHPDARLDGAEVDEPPDGVVDIPLARFDPNDNEAYVFADPGPEDVENTNSSQCGHCHYTIHRGWYASPHRSAASNPALHDLYQGLAVAFSDASTCASAGGTWGEAGEPGTGATVERCVVAPGVAEATGGTGACADCHAPGIDGALGGRDLLDATGVAYDAGVHCDVCHHVESVDMDAEAGVAGRLHVVRPSEPDAMTTWEPLTFGPLADVLNPAMGSVLRTEFHEPEICGGCHELWQPAEVDLARWPDGRLPVHTTYGEWKASPFDPAAPCQSCHMPPLPGVGNAADLHNEFEDVLIGVAAGWERAAGEVHAHSWVGPRQRESGMLELAAAVSIEGEVDAGALTARVTVKNVGPGHAIPTGEPLRSLVLFVEATCDGQALPATGGAAIPDYGGALAVGTDPLTWPGAEVGDVIRAVRRTGEWVDYEGFGAFGDGTFSAEEKGLPVEEVVGSANVVAVAGDTVTLDAELPAADVYYRGEPAQPTDGADAAMVAGAPGFAFARVLVDAAGERMVPHFLAVDVASDNRLLPQAAWTTEHVFAASCDAPEVHATLVHRAWPPGLARARGWALTESVMAEAWW
ncbi:MAG: hypothetical protein ACOZNI_24560 [Myxococcota bacterium]